MLVVQNTILSDDIFEKYFACDLSQCKGCCCIEGDAGAPLDEEEISIMEDIIEKVKPYMCHKGIECVDYNGVFDYDMNGQLVTPLVDDCECAFVYLDKGIAKCAFEKAFLEKKTSFQKPISCHLYPIRILTYDHYEALNYHQWPICKQACENGKNRQITLFEFLKIPLIRKYGKRWYNTVRKESELYLKNKRDLTFK